MRGTLNSPEEEEIREDCLAEPMIRNDNAAINDAEFNPRYDLRNRFITFGLSDLQIGLVCIVVIPSRSGLDIPGSASFQFKTGDLASGLNTNR